jgi:hypothetical protein
MGTNDRAGARLRRRGLQGLSVAGVGVAVIALMAQYGGGTIATWWEVGETAAMPLTATIDDPTGSVRIYNHDGGVATANHAFFERIGTNGRACVTCHQPSNAMGLSTDRLAERWKATQGKDPVFAAVDGANCPNLPQGEKSSHSLLLNRGVFRIYLPWPGIAADGTPVVPDFKIEVVRDPTGCNTDPVYGLNSPHPTISVYRRPRMVANLKYVLGSDAAFEPGAAHAVGALMADGREPNLETQAVDAAIAHEQAKTRPTPAQIAQILNFESQVYAAQDFDAKGGDLTEVDGPHALGAWHLGKSEVDRGGTAPVFLTAEDWVRYGNNSRDPARRAFRESVVRGNAIFSSRTFTIDGTANLDTVHPGARGKVVTGTCATCHNAAMTGSAAREGWMDIGTTMTSATGQDSPDLPLFKITCNAAAEAHPYLGRVLYTTDPGRALVTGRCKDVGSIVMQQFRGLAARAPYFANGSAKDLDQLVDYYDRRFAIRLSDQDKKDLRNFMSVL